MQKYSLIKNTFLYSFLSIIMILLPVNSFASVASDVNKANDLYKQGKFEDSLSLYQAALDKDDKSSAIQYDLGTDLYKKGDYDKALGYLEDAAQDSDVKIKPKAEYNLGNVLYKSGIKKENTNVDDAIKTLQSAVGHYSQAIALDPKDQDAVDNQEFVKKVIEKLKQQKQNQSSHAEDSSKSQQQQQNQQKQQNQQEQSSHAEDSSKSQQQQQNQQDQQKNTQEQKKDQSQGQQGKQKEHQAQSQAEQEQKDLDRKAAEDTLEEYQENEEPKKLLNYMPKKIDDRPVLKDW